MLENWLPFSVFCFPLERPISQPVSTTSMIFFNWIFSFVNGPLFATFLLGMFWKRTTGHGAFWGLVAGTLAAAITHGLTIAEGKGGWISPIYPISSGMGQAFIVASFSWIANFFTTIAVMPCDQAQARRRIERIGVFPDRKSIWY